MVCLHGKVNLIVASQMFSLLTQLTCITNFSFNIECFKNFLHFSTFSTVSGAQLKEAGF